MFSVNSSALQKGESANSDGFSALVAVPYLDCEDENLFPVEERCCLLRGETDALPLATNFS